MSLLKDVLGDRLPQGQETRLRRILAKKDTAQYGARYLTVDEARTLLSHLQDYAAWATREFDR